MLILLFHCLILQLQLVYANTSDQSNDVISMPKMSHPVYQVSLCMVIIIVLVPQDRYIHALEPILTLLLQ